jgi:hypothetical protein
MLLSKPDGILSDSYVKIKVPKELSLTQKQAFKMSDPALLCEELPNMLILIDAQNGTFHYAKIEEYLDEEHQRVYDYCTQQSVAIPTANTRALKLVPQILYQPRLPVELLAAYFRGLLTNQPYTLFPFLSGCIVSPDTVIIVIGDLHGHEKAWRKIAKNLYADGVLNKDGLIKPNHLIVFLGDLTDRGHYGPEIWYKVLQLAIKNPQKILIQVGNHGTPSLAKNFCPGTEYSFFSQLKKILCLDDTNIEALIQTMYSQFPQGIVLGIDPQDTSPNQNSPYHFILFCHGGFDRFSSTLKDLIKQLVENHKKTAAKELNYIFDNPDPEHSGYLWTDFRANSTKDECATIEPSCRGSGLYRYNTSAVRNFFKQFISKKPEHPYILDCLVRGHEHIEDAIGKLNTVIDKGHNWTPLENQKTEFADPGSVYTVISSIKYALSHQTMRRIAYLGIEFSQEKKRFYMTLIFFLKPKIS